jgi:gas vesicle protein
MNDSTKVLAALLAGLAAGAALGILFAPEKGIDTRDKINDAFRNLSDSIKDRAAEEIDNLSSLKEKVVDNLKSRLSQTDSPVSQASSPVTDQI